MLLSLAGKGPVGSLIKRYKLAEYVSRNQQRLVEAGSRLTTPALAVVRSVFATIVGLVTILVLTFLMVLQGPTLVASWLAALPERRQEHVRRVAADCSRAVVGYMTGNLAISVIAGTLTYIVLWIMGVPYKGVVALFVGFADLIPLVGATLGAIVAVGGRPALAPGRDRGAGVLHRLPAGREPPAAAGHHVAHRPAQRPGRAGQRPDRGRTVRLPGGPVGHPGGVISVISRDLYDSYRGHPKPEPTLGEDQVPVSSLDAPDRSDQDPGRPVPPTAVSPDPPQGKSEPEHLTGETSRQRRRMPERTTSGTTI